MLKIEVIGMEIVSIRRFWWDEDTQTSQAQRWEREEKNFTSKAVKMLQISREVKINSRKFSVRFLCCD